MKRIISIASFAIFAASLIGCEAPKPVGNASNAANTNANANANAAKPMAAAPTKEGLFAIENKAFEAWKNKDGKHFEGLLTDSFVAYADGKRTNKADEIKMITDSKCEVKSYSLSEEKMTPVGPDAVVLTSKSTVDGTCDGQKIPSPSIAATLFVRSGSEWKAAYHNEVPIKDGKAPAPVAKKETPAKPADAKPADALTDALMAIEKKGWDGWRTQDAKALQETTATDLGFVDASGKATFSQAEVIKMWTAGKCEIKSAGPTDGMASSISPTVAILTYKGNADGTCDGQKLQNLWGTSIFVKEGDMWKAAYIFETPM